MNQFLPSPHLLFLPPPLPPHSPFRFSSVLLWVCFLLGTNAGAALPSLFSHRRSPRAAHGVLRVLYVLCTALGLRTSAAVCVHVCVCVRMRCGCISLFKVNMWSRRVSSEQRLRVYCCGCILTSCFSWSHPKQSGTNTDHETLCHCPAMAYWERFLFIYNQNALLHLMVII